MKNSLHNFNFVRVLASVIYFCECALWIMTAILYVLVTHFCGDQLDDFTRWHTYTHTRKMKRNVKKWHNISKSKIVWICLSKFLWFSMLNDDGMKTFQRTSLFIGFTKCGYVWDVQLPLHFIKMKFKSRTHCTMCVYFMALFAFLYTTCLPISANERVSDKEKNYWKNHRNIIHSMGFVVLWFGGKNDVCYTSKKMHTSCIHMKSCCRKWSA